MKTLGNTNIKWAWFKYDDIFIIQKGKRLTKAEMIDGNINYIGATDSNNGITATIGNSECVYDGNKITVSYNGSIAEAFYQKKPFWATDDVNVLSLKHYTLNVYIAMFLTTLIHIEKYRFNYGRKWDKALMQQTNIKLPVKSNNTPDWKWIEQYVKDTIIPKLPSRARLVWESKYNNKPIHSADISLDSVKWDWFNIKDIFPRIEKCKCSNATELLEDGIDIAYIGAKKSDNGVMRYVKYDETLVTEGNCIVFIGDGQGSVGYCIYQPKDFIGSTTLVAGYNPHLNQYIAQFLITILDMERYRYSFGRKYNKAAITSTKIKLPSKSDGSPDWEFMENYIKSLPYSANL